jgi:hypothetical protein
MQSSLDAKDTELDQAQQGMLVLLAALQEMIDPIEDKSKLPPYVVNALELTEDICAKYADKLRAEGGVKALEDAALEFNEAGTVSMNDVSKFLRRTASELHGGGECVIFAKK